MPTALINDDDKRGRGPIRGRRLSKSARTWRKLTKKSSSSFNYANVTNKALRGATRRSTLDAGLDAGAAVALLASQPRRLLLLPLTNSRAAFAQQRRRRWRRCLWPVVVVVAVVVFVVGSVACLWLLCALIACCPVTQARATASWSHVSHPPNQLTQRAKPPNQPTNPT